MTAIRRRQGPRARTYPPHLGLQPLGEDWAIRGPCPGHQRRLAVLWGMSGGRRVRGACRMGWTQTLTSFPIIEETQWLPGHQVHLLSCMVSEENLVYIYKEMDR